MKKISIEVYDVSEKLPEYECEHVLVFTDNFTQGVDAFFQGGQFWLDGDLDFFFEKETIIGWCYYPSKELL